MDLRTDQKTFADYARLFMALKTSQLQGFLGSCWEKYLGGHHQALIPPVMVTGIFNFLNKQHSYPRI